MRTIYYKTSNFIEHSGNLVDLNEFRRKQAMAMGDSLAREDSLSPEEDDGFRPAVLAPTPRQRRRERRERWAWTLDLCVSLAVILTAVLFSLRVLL